MSTCRYDADVRDYLRPDGEPCRNDDYGDPTRHCSARRTCSQHVGANELTCARCIGRTRQDLRQVVELSALMLPQAIADGVDSEAANLAGPGADPAVLIWRRILAKRWIENHIPPAKWEAAIQGLIEDDDERNPLNVLSRWQTMLADEWGHNRPERLTVAGAAAYLERQLGRLAQDPEQDWAAFAREVRRVRTHMESVLHNDTRPDKGVPCPTCREDGHYVRLARRWGHWCDDPDCARFHHADTTDDRWVCQRNAEHVWTHAAYSNYLEERGSTA